MRINLAMALRIMFLNMLKLRRSSESVYIPVQVPQPLMQRRVSGANVSDVALEMLYVHGVEADDGGV